MERAKGEGGVGPHAQYLAELLLDKHKAIP
jgi:hypothetical protein